MRAASVILVCLALAGCSVRMYGNRTTSGGATTTVSAAAISGSAEFAGGKVAFSSGQEVPPRGAPGGHLKLSSGAAAVLIVGVVVADLINYIRGDPAPKPLPPGTRIADTCSCFQKPVTSDR